MRLVIEIPSLARAVGFLKPGSLLPVFHVNIAENGIGAFVVPGARISANTFRGISPNNSMSVKAKRHRCFKGELMASNLSIEQVAVKWTQMDL